MERGPTGVRAALEMVWRHCSTLWRPADRRSPITAALLNLTALGIGYAYLGAWRRALKHGLTTSLMVVGFVVAAARIPWVWMALFIGWVAWMAYDGWRQGRRLIAEHQSSRLLPRPAWPVIIAVLLVSAILAGYGQYLQAGDRAFAAADNAYTSGDCESAKVAYERSATFYQWTLNPNGVVAAEARIRECNAFLSAVQFQENQEFDKAVMTYDKFLQEYHSSPLTLHARERLAGTHFDHANVLLEQGKIQDGIAKYVSVLRRYPMTAAAMKTPQAIIDAYIVQVETPYYEGRPCDVLQTLKYFASLSEDETRTVSANAHQLRPIALFACGVQEANSDQPEEARTQFETLKSEYSTNPLAAEVPSNSRFWSFVGSLCDSFKPCAALKNLWLAIRDCIFDLSSNECKERITDLVSGLAIPIRLGSSKSAINVDPGPSRHKPEPPGKPETDPVPDPSHLETESPSSPPSPGGR